MTSKAILNVRTDAAVKKAAQKAAKDLGVPLSVVVNASLRAFVRNPRLELEPLLPNAATRRALKTARKRDTKEPVFGSVDDLLADLNS